MQAVTRLGPVFGPGRFPVAALSSRLRPFRQVAGGVGVVWGADLLINWRLERLILEVSWSPYWAICVTGGMSFGTNHDVSLRMSHFVVNHATKRLWLTFREITLGYRGVHKYLSPYVATA